MIFFNLIIRNMKDTLYCIPSPQTNQFNWIFKNFHFHFFGSGNSYMTSILPSKSFIFFLYFHLQNFVFFIFSLTFSNLLLLSWYLTRELLTSFQNFWCIKLFLRRPLKNKKLQKSDRKIFTNPKSLPNPYFFTDRK